MYVERWPLVIVTISWFDAYTPMLADCGGAPAATDQRSKSRACVEDADDRTEPNEHGPRVLAMFIQHGAAKGGMHRGNHGCMSLVVWRSFFFWGFAPKPSLGLYPWTPLGTSDPCFVSPYRIHAPVQNCTIPVQLSVQ